MATSKSVAIILKMVGSMSKLEKKELKEYMVPILGIRKSASSNPYWIKQVAGIDPMQKGPYQLVGDFLRDTKGLPSSTDPLVIAVKFPDRKYVAAIVSAGDTVKIVSGTQTYEFDDVKSLHESDRFADVLDYVTTRLGKKKVA